MSIETSPDAVDIKDRDVEPFRCEKCGTPFTTGDELRRHAELTHKREGSAATITRRTAIERRKKEKGKSVKSAKGLTTKRKSKTTAKRRPNSKRTGGSNTTKRSK